MDKNTILEQLRNRGCRITKQREVLIDIILEENCTSCKEIYFLAVKRDSKIGMATVYRMVRTLEEIQAIKPKAFYPIQKYIQVQFEDDDSARLWVETMRSEYNERGGY